MARLAVEGAAVLAADAVLGDLCGVPLACAPRPGEPEAPFFAPAAALPSLPAASLFFSCFSCFFFCCAVCCALVCCVDDGGWFWNVAWVDGMGAKWTLCCVVTSDSVRDKPCAPI